MRSLKPLAGALLACLASVAFALPAQAQPLQVDVWTDKGDEAVYQPGDPLQVSVQTNVGAHLLVYEIDAEGRINVIFPIGGFEDYVEGGQVYDIPNHQTDLELVVQGPVGQGYIVAIASRQPFEPLPWYLRPYDAQAEALGYHGVAEEDEGITSEGRIVGDPFVAMEKIRRRVVTDDQNPDAFYASYTTYYVHEVVKYPRYICSDCHRPGHYTWWADYDPYYATCSAFSFRVNVGWYWGPGYWFGYVPRYIYVCNPGYTWNGRYWFSGWYGWNYWNACWGGPLRAKHYKAPANYIPPKRYKETGGRPPGFITYNDLKKRTPTVGRNRPADPRGGTDGVRIARDLDRRAERQPARGVTERERGGVGADRGGVSRMPARQSDPGERTRTIGDARKSGDVGRDATREPARKLEPRRGDGGTKFVRPAPPRGRSTGITTRSSGSTSRMLRQRSNSPETKRLSARPLRSNGSNNVTRMSTRSSRSVPRGAVTRANAGSVKRQAKPVRTSKVSKAPARTTKVSKAPARSSSKPSVSSRNSSRGSAGRGASRGASRGSAKGR